MGLDILDSVASIRCSSYEQQDQPSTEYSYIKISDTHDNGVCHLHERGSKVQSSDSSCCFVGLLGHRCDLQQYVLLRFRTRMTSIEGKDTFVKSCIVQVVLVGYHCSTVLVSVVQNIPTCTSLRSAVLVRDQKLTAFPSLIC